MNRELVILWNTLLGLEFKTDYRTWEKYIERHDGECPDPAFRVIGYVMDDGSEIRTE